MDVQLVSRIVLGLILGVSALGKWLNVRWFISVIREYRLLPRQLSEVTAVAVIASESILGWLLVAGWWQPWAAISAFGLLTIFSAAVLVNVARRRLDMECGCIKGLGQHPVSWLTVSRNAGFLLLATMATDLSSTEWVRSGRGFALAMALLCSPYIAGSLHRAGKWRPEYP